MDSMVKDLYPDSPFFALSVEFSVDDIISVMLDIDGDLPEKLFEAEPPSNTQPQDDVKLIEVITRLLWVKDLVFALEN